MPAKYKYRLTNEYHGSEIYGPCEVCGKSVDVVYHQVELQEYGFGWTLTGRELFGHNDCLISKQRNNN